MKIPKMTIWTLSALAMGLGLSAALMAQGAGPRRDGRWEVRVEMDMPEMPVKMPPMTTIQCVTKEDAADPQKSMPSAPKAPNADSKCTVTDHQIVGNKVTWKTKCEGRMPMTGAGEIVYGADSYDGSMTMEQQNGQVMTMKYTGKRLGDCVK